MVRFCFLTLVGVRSSFFYQFPLCDPASPSVKRDNKSLSSGSYCEDKQVNLRKKLRIGPVCKECQAISAVVIYSTLLPWKRKWGQRRVGGQGVGRPQQFLVFLPYKYSPSFYWKRSSKSQTYFGSLPHKAINNYMVFVQIWVVFSPLPST